MRHTVSSTEANVKYFEFLESSRASPCSVYQSLPSLLVVKARHVCTACSDSVCDLKSRIWPQQLGWIFSRHSESWPFLPPRLLPSETFLARLPISFCSPCSASPLLLQDPIGAVSGAHHHLRQDWVTCESSASLGSSVDFKNNPNTFLDLKPSPNLRRISSPQNSYVIIKWLAFELPQVSQ